MEMCNDGNVATTHVTDGFQDGIGEQRVEKNQFVT